jgi:hypothetical protein
LSCTIASASLVDTITVLALPLVFLTATLLVVVRCKISEAAHFITFIRAIEALGISITDIAFWDALSVFAGILRFWVAATFGDVVEGELLEATFSVTFISSISALGFSITHLIGFDTVSVGTLPFRFLAATFLVVVVSEIFEAAVR